nr:hypothetical protein [uncultured Dyadobacter sp.]
MADYQAKSTDSLTFDLTGGKGLIGSLSYKNWFSFSASIKMAHNLTYQVEPKGFWSTTIEVKQEGNQLLTFAINWHGDIVMQTHFYDVTAHYLFKHRGVFRESFVLTDHDGSELLAMTPDLKWRTLNYDYHITTSERFESLASKELMLLTCLHCVNYYMSMIANVVGA